MQIEIDQRIAAKLDERLKKQAVDATPAVEEVEEPSVDRQVEDEESTGRTVPIRQRSSKLAESMERLRVISQRYGFRPFSEAVQAVENDWRELKSGIDLIS